MNENLDEWDRKLLMELQRDSNRSFDRIANIVGLSKTAVWNRVQRFIQNGTILRQAAILDPKKVGIEQTFFVQIRTNRHDDEWLRAFHTAVERLPEITEAHRLAGTIDYILKVQVPSTEAYDIFYKKLVKEISISDVSSSLSMQTMKRSLEIDLLNS